MALSTNAIIDLDHYRTFDTIQHTNSFPSSISTTTQKNQKRKEFESLIDVVERVVVNESLNKKKKVVTVGRTRACDLCKKRKIRCDKKDQCSNCVLHGTLCSAEIPSGILKRSRTKSKPTVVSRKSDSESIKVAPPPPIRTRQVQPTIDSSRLSLSSLEEFPDEDDEEDETLYPSYFQTSNLTPPTSTYQPGLSLPPIILEENSLSFTPHTTSNNMLNRSSNVVLEEIDIDSKKKRKGGKLLEKQISVPSIESNRIPVRYESPPFHSVPPISYNIPGEVFYDQPYYPPQYQFGNYRNPQTEFMFVLPPNHHHHLPHPHHHQYHQHLQQQHYQIQQHQIQQQRRLHQQQQHRHQLPNYYPDRYIDVNTDSRPSSMSSNNSTSYSHSRSHSQPTSLYDTIPTHHKQSSTEYKFQQENFSRSPPQEFLVQDYNNNKQFESIPTLVPQISIIPSTPLPPIFNNTINYSNPINLPPIKNLNLDGNVMSSGMVGAMDERRESLRLPSIRDWFGE